jgi:flagellar biosynthesis regulator FlbT
MGNQVVYPVQTGTWAGSLAETESVKIDGASVIFDKKVALMPVNLETKIVKGDANQPGTSTGPAR